MTTIPTRSVWLAAALALMGAAAALAQTANFSGTWQFERHFTPNAAPAEGAAPGTVATIARGGSTGIGLSGGFGQIGQLIKSRPPDQLVIKQTLTEVTVDERWKASVESAAYHRAVTYRLDGGESRVRVPGGEMVLTSSWKDGKLVTVGTRGEAGGRGFGGAGTEEMRSLSPDGQVLTIESVSRGRSGGTITTLIFRKASGG